MAYMPPTPEEICAMALASRGCNRARQISDLRLDEVYSHRLSWLGKIWPSPGKYSALREAIAANKE